MIYSIEFIIDKPFVSDQTQMRSDYLGLDITRSKLMFDTQNAYIKERHSTNITQVKEEKQYNIIHM